MRYETDILAWSIEQAEHLRAGRFELLDLENIAEEILDVGKSEQRELANRMALLLAHLLKWQFQPERRGNSWRVTIQEQRRALRRRISRTPSLTPCLTDSDWLADAWLDARTMAANETGLGFDAFPETCPWTTQFVLESDSFLDSGLKKNS